MVDQIFTYISVNKKFAWRIRVKKIEHSVVSLMTHFKIKSQLEAENNKPMVYKVGSFVNTCS